MGESRAGLDEFFLVALPGLEDLVAAEVTDWFPDLQVRLDHGGVTVFAPRTMTLALNQYLRTPTRVLLRVAQFRCRDFPKLFQYVRDLEWQDWFDPTYGLDVEASSRLSRLKIKKRIAETVFEAFDAYRMRVGATVASKKMTSKKVVKMFVRFHTDQCTLSLDTSGERLHKRGEKTLVGEAPLRETIAAALIQWMGREMGAGGGVDVIDPMMGSGTFLVEAALRDHPVSAREFSASYISGASQDKITDFKTPVRPKIIRLLINA